MDTSAKAEQLFTAATQMLLDSVKRAGFPPLNQLPVEQARQAYRMGVAATALAPTPVQRQESFEIPSPQGPIRAKLWADSHEPGLPLMLYLHGGGFVIGSIGTCESMCSAVAKRSGVAVVAIDYRLAPEHRYPAGLEDAVAALEWLHRNAASMGLDGQRLAVGGDSAGGTLAAATALWARDEGWPLKLQALFYPSVQLGQHTESLERFAKSTLLTWDLMHWFERQARGGHLAQRWYREPMHADSHAGVAPAWIGLAECDPLTDEGQLYAQRLRQAGVPVSLTVWPGVIHDFINMGRFLPEAQQAHDALADALRAALMP